MAVTFVGETDFAQSATERWGRRGWELDTLAVPYQGAVSKLSSFLNARAIWSPSDIDNNLYLERIDNDDDKQYPTVTLHYIGRRNGTRPPARRGAGVSIQSGSYHTQGTNNGSDYTIDADVQYLAPTSSITTVTNAPEEGGTVGNYAAATVTPIWWTIRYTGDITVSPDILNYFVQTTVTTTQSNELVPGEWYENTTTNTLMLFPVS